MSDLITWIVTIMVFQGVAALVNRANKAKAQKDRENGTSGQNSENQVQPEQRQSPNSEDEFDENVITLKSLFESVEPKSNTEPEDSIQKQDSPRKETIDPSRKQSNQEYKKQDAKEVHNTLADPTDRWDDFKPAAEETLNPDLIYHDTTEEDFEESEYQALRALRKEKSRLESLLEENSRLDNKPRYLDRIPQKTLLQQGILWREVLGKPKGLH